MFRVIFCHLLRYLCYLYHYLQDELILHFFQMCWQNHQLEMYMASPEKKWPQHVDMTPKQNKFTEDVFSPPSGFDVLKVGGTTQRCLKERGGWTACEMTGGALHGSAGVFFWKFGVLLKSKFGIFGRCESLGAGEFFWGMTFSPDVKATFFFNWLVISMIAAIFNQSFTEEVLCFIKQIVMMVHPWKLTLQWKLPMFKRKYMFKWWIFHCHVSFRGGLSWMMKLRHEWRKI